jgi:hypothetical protein
MKGPHNFKWNRPFDAFEQNQGPKQFLNGTGLVPLSGADEMIPVFWRDYTFSIHDG